MPTQKKQAFQFKKNFQKRFFCQQKIQLRSKKTGLNSVEEEKRKKEKVFFEIFAAGQDF